MTGRRAVGESLLAAVEVMDRLRSPGGCPWDAAQTHESLAPYLVEETYETLDAIAADDPVALREELGDVLLQVLFHARLAAERADCGFDIDDVAADLVAKLTRRHPHVFGTDAAGASDAAGAIGATGADGALSTAEVEANWEQLKQAEKQRESVTDGIATAGPALALAAALQRRAARRAELADVAAGLVVLPSAAPDPTDALDPTTVGAQLFALAGRATAAGIDPEQALRAHAMRYRAALRAAEGVNP